MHLLIVIPTYNEEEIIEKNLLKLYDFLKQNFINVTWQIVVADNKSTDRTAEIVKNLAKKLPRIKYFYLNKKGKGIAVKSTWQNFEADIYCFMDADLATDLSSLPNLIKAVSVEGYDVALGARFLKESIVKRSILRRLFSFGYHLLTKILIGTKIKDLPCGFKAINKKVKVEILPWVKNNEWFFDSELVLLAEKEGFKIKEVPVKWQDKRLGEDKSKVRILALSLVYFKKILELKKRFK